jgi:hypothetical protein
MERFGEKDGAYICSFAEVRSLANILRLSILKAFQITRSHENKGDKCTSFTVILPVQNLVNNEKQYGKDS